MTKETSSTVYCYHCRAAHPKEDMRLIVSKTGKRWRCIHSIEAAQKDRGQREEFGRQITQANKAEGQKQQRLMLASTLKV